MPSMNPLLHRMMINLRKSPKSSLQALNKISKRAQWIKVSDAPPTITRFQRPAPFSEPTTISTRYKKQNSRAAHLKAYIDTQTKSQYVKKSHYQQTSSKILLKKASTIPSEVNLQLHKEIKHEDFPPLPNSQRQSQHQIDGHQTTQQLLLEILNKYNL